MLPVESRIKNIVKEWFFSEPLLFSTYCTHTLVENNKLTIPMRSGKKLIEYSSDLLSVIEDDKIEAYLKVEIYRILLQHPYTRQPYDAKPGILLIASDYVIYSQCEHFENINLPGVEYLKSQAVRFHTLNHPMGIKWHDSDEEKFFQRNLQIDHRTGVLHSVEDLSFEEWYRWILFLVKETSAAGENAGNGDGDIGLFAQASELWEENQEVQKELQSQIEKADMDEGWGGLGGSLQRKLRDSCDFSFDYRRALAQFRQNIVSANRKLTRMRPSRRYGFKAMGSRYERKANILIAVDVSGSITDESFEHFTHAIKNFFFLGIIEKMDLIFFDVNLKYSKPVTFRKKINLDEIKGRGGTNFQPAIDYYENHKSEYSGMIIFSDGEGNMPSVHSDNILWILDSRLAYEKSRQWITLTGGKSTWLPF